MRTCKNAAAVIITIATMAATTVGGDPCGDQKADTMTATGCSWLCTGECTAHWTDSTTLWCSEFPGYNCKSVALDPPYPEVDVYHAFGACELVNSKCKCAVDPNTQWQGKETIMWVTANEICPHP
jgi:hypothetical protein